ncbi:MAG TPA: hypothetical protein DCZ93_05185 [Elusimicrobia bacterium]|nr:hypothetical protein [Elusimicrobiota bacterium]
MAVIEPRKKRSPAASTAFEFSFVINYISAFAKINYRYKSLARAPGFSKGIRAQKPIGLKVPGWRGKQAGEDFFSGLLVL